MATTRIYKLSTQVVATTNAAAQVTIQQNGVLTGILFAGFLFTGAAAGALNYELSFQSTAQIATNDTVGPIAQAAMAGPLTSAAQFNSLVAALNVPLRSGDKLYVNVEANGTAATAARTNIYLFVSQ